MIKKYLYIKKTNGKGRGVFTRERLEKNTLIEESPVIVMSAEDRILLDKTLLYDYIFAWGNDSAQCCMALGYIPIYNHSFESNCEYYMNFEEGIIQVKTVRTIEANEELTINYNGDWDDKKPLWFEAKE